MLSITDRLTGAYEYFKTRFDVRKPFTSETAFLKYTKEFLELAGVLVIREAYSTKNGTADIICCYLGRFLAIELKDDEGKASKQQLKFIADVQKHMGYGVVVNTIQELYDLLQLVLQDVTGN